MSLKTSKLDQKKDRLTSWSLMTASDLWKWFYFTANKLTLSPNYSRPISFLSKMAFSLLDLTGHSPCWSIRLTNLSNIVWTENLQNCRSPTSILKDYRSSTPVHLNLSLLMTAPKDRRASTSNNSRKKWKTKTQIYLNSSTYRIWVPMNVATSADFSRWAFGARNFEGVQIIITL